MADAPAPAPAPSAADADSSSADSVARHNGDDGDDLEEGDVSHHEADGVEVEGLEDDDEDLKAHAPGSTAFQLWGKPGHLTEKEQDRYNQFREQISEEELLAHKNPHDDVEQFALRWLRARDFKVEAAVSMYRDHMKCVRPVVGLHVLSVFVRVSACVLFVLWSCNMHLWVALRCIHNICSNLRSCLCLCSCSQLHACRWVAESGFYELQFAPLSDIVGTTEVDENFIIQNYPCGIKGHDRLGRPLYFKWYGKMKPKAIAKKVDAVHAARWESVIGCLRVPYVLAESSKQHGFHVEEMVVIIDCKGFKMKTFNKYVREVLKHAADISSPNYPEALGMCIVVNAPWFVKTIWAVARGFLAKRTRKKFRILGKKFRKVRACHPVVAAKVADPLMPIPLASS